MSRDRQFVLFRNAIPDGVCQQIIDEGEKSRPETARVYKSKDDQPIDLGYRSASVALWDAHHWSAGLLFHYAVVANSQTWKFDIQISQGAQFARYECGDHFDWHKDEFSAPLTEKDSPVWAGLNRKLTVVLMLSRPDDRTGGMLTLRDAFGRDIDSGNDYEAINAKGSVVVFPSYVPHKVTAISAGMRYSLTGWIVGPPFK